MTKQIRKLNVAMKGCCCDRCGPASLTTYEKERLGLDAKTLKPNYEYRKYTWYSADEEYNNPKHFENVAWSAEDKIWGKYLVVNNGDSEASTREKYEINNYL